MRRSLKLFSLRFIALFLGLLALPATATTHYVDANGSNPVAPYISWATAATNIQDALAYPGIILVTNGVYQYGGANMNGSNRVFVISQLLQSVNGPAVTTIVGYQTPGTTNGTDAMRCAYLGSGSILSGFTLTNGATSPSSFYGGGVDCADSTCLITNCVIVGNAAYGTGGGVYLGTLVNCILENNSALGIGADTGGGIANGTLINCILAGNSCNYRGGAAVGCTLINCTIAGNSGELDTCDSCTLKNCISYYNSSGTVDGTSDSSSYINCCLPSIPTFNSANNFTNPPVFVNWPNQDFHLSPASPCINAGSNAFVTVSNDLDGNPRIVYGIVDLGAYESPYSGQRNVHYVSLDSTNPISPFNDWTIAATNIQDALDASTNGDRVWVTNGTYATGGRNWFGSGTNRVILTNTVTLQSVNGPAVTLIVGGHGVGNAARCVGIGNGAVLSGFTLTNGEAGGGNYPNGGGVAYIYGLGAATITNCVLVNNVATNNAGGGAYRVTLVNCQLIGNYAASGGGACACTLINCVITNNTAINGGGVYGNTTYGASVLAHCTLAGNSAVGGTGTGQGGGAYGGTLYVCSISNNTAVEGGGAYGSILCNSLIVGNSALSDGGGLYSGTITNCTVASNSAGSQGGGIYGNGGDYCYNSIIYYNNAPTWPNLTLIKPINCCTIPLGTVTNEPLFVNLAGNDFHLQSNSPCINAGENIYVQGPNDLDGNPRIVGGTVDMGAYEYQTPASVISYAYLEQYGLPTDGSVDYSDLDGTGFNVYQDWIAGLNPTNSASVLAMLAPAAVNNATGITVSWQSVSSILYNLQRSTNLTAPSPFITIQSNIVGQAGTTSYQDTSATNNLPYFYRVGVP